MKIYTRTGDDGSTALFSGERVQKNTLRVEVYGTVDEMSAALGVARVSQPHAGVKDYLEELQLQLFHAGAELATIQKRSLSNVDGITEEDISWLEAGIDKMTSELPGLSNFILPGGTMAAAQIHVARTICRRAERLAVGLAEQEALRKEMLVYLNRLSDFLFTLARWENFLAGVSEAKWTSH